MVTDTIHAPAPLRYGPCLRQRDGSPIVINDHRRGDWINLTTGECHVAHLIHGIRCDTEQADLVVSRSSADGGYFRTRNLFRGHHGYWFLSLLAYNLDWYACEGGTFALLADEDVLPKLKETLHAEDPWPLLRDWYLHGWIPRDDAFVQEWAEATLSADECEQLLIGFQTMPSMPSR